jgi:hypothetical protein
MLGDACLVLGLVEGPLEISFMQVVSPAISRLRIPKQRGSRKGVLPTPLSVRARIFSRQGVWEIHPAIPRPEILFVEPLDGGFLGFRPPIPPLSRPFRPHLLDPP